MALNVISKNILIFLYYILVTKILQFIKKMAVNSNIEYYNFMTYYKDVLTATEKMDIV